MYKEEDIYLSNGALIVKKDEYSLSKILAVRTKELRLKDQLIRILSISLAFSAVGWAILPITGPLLMLIGVVIGILTSKKYALSAEFRGVDESGDHWVPIARGRTHEEFILFKDIEKRINTGGDVGYKEC